MYVSTMHIKIGKQQHTQRFGSPDIQGTTETLDSPLRLKSVVDFNRSGVELMLALWKIPLKGFSDIQRAWGMIAVGHFH